MHSFILWVYISKHEIKFFRAQGSLRVALNLMDNAAIWFIAKNLYLYTLTCAKLKKQLANKLHPVDYTCKVEDSLEKCSQSVV